MTDLIALLASLPDTPSGPITVWTWEELLARFDEIAEGEVEA